MKKNVLFTELREGMVTADDIFIPGTRYTIAYKNTPLTNHILRVIRYHKIPYLPIEIVDGELLPPPDLPDIEPVIGTQLKEESMTGIRKVFETVAAGDTEKNLTTAYKAVGELDIVVDRLVDSLSVESNALVHIADLKSFDEYTFHHSLSVAILFIAIGISMKLEEDELKLLGRCAILHDIGKMLIPSDIINKPAKLTDEEFELMKKHTEYGFNYLRKGGIGNYIIWFCVLMHHEKSNGLGYPSGLRNDNIPLYAKVISVADVYDAVTSYRSYRVPMAPEDALELIMSGVDNGFEYKIVKSFIDKISLYPINTCVELNNGRRGIVTSNNNAKRPTLQMLDSDEVIDLCEFRHLTLFITKVIDVWK